jgi:proline dehydrogenase
VPARSSSDARRLPARLVIGRVLTGLLTGRLVAGPRILDAVRVAGELVADGRLVALEHVPGPEDDAVAELAALIGEVHAAGLSADCELTLPVDRLGAAPARTLAAAAADRGLAVVLAGADADLDGGALPGAGIVVPAGEHGAEARCRKHASGRVRLTEGRGAAADLAFVRCLNVLMAGDGHPEIAASDRRLIAIAGERAAWNGRTPDSWEHVMPYGVLTDAQHRLVAGGYAVRVAVPSGEGAAALVALRLGGRA